jgi:hypothetical protein
MHCKHCGNQIEDDSKFCSFCGGKIKPINQPKDIQQSIIDKPIETDVTTNTEIELNSTKNTDEGYLIGGFIFFGVQLFWVLFTKLIDNWHNYDYVGKIVNLVFMGIPIVFAIYVKQKNHKIILLILGVLLMIWSIYQNFIQ